MFYINFGDFLNNPLSFSFNNVWQKIPFVSVFDFLGATGLEKGKGQRARVENFEMNKRDKVGHQEISNLKRGPGGAISPVGRATCARFRLERPMPSIFTWFSSY
jgi:hypothetical protein